MKRFLTAVTMVVVAAGMSAQSAAPSPAAKYDGRWAVATVNGNPTGVEMILAFTGGKYEQLIDGVVTEEGTLTFDLAQTPNHVDLGIATGQDAGKIQRGVLEVSGDTMSLSLSAPDADPARPASVAEGALVVVALRVK